MKPITFTTSILSVTVLGAALLALGSIGFSSTPGEMSKIAYTGNLWCVSNLVQETDASGSLVYADSGLAKNDPRLKGKENLIRREQVTGETQDEVETKATKAGLWEKSNKDELRAALDKNNAEGDNFYTHHFNQGATHPGPCLGSGTSTIEGMWINDAINKDCFGAQDQTGQYAVVKTLRANITWYSPNMPGNTCDSQTGGDANTAGGGMFRMVNGRIRYVQGSSIENYVFAEPQTDNIIPRNLWDTQAIVIPGFNNDQPIHIRDHYAANNHLNENYLDLFAPCNERSGLPTGSQTIKVVDLNKPVQTVASSTSKTKTIAIDPGHGSVINTRPYEGPTELAIGQKLSALLKAEGYNVVMTHNSLGQPIGGVKASNEKQDNIARAEIANNNNADLTIRLHSDNTTKTSFAVLYPDKQTTDPYGFSGPKDASVIGKSQTLAKDIQSALSAAGYNGSTVGDTSGFGAGGHIETFAAHANAPVVTLELYGHNSSALRQKYASSAEQDKVARALAKGVDAFEGATPSGSQAQINGAPTKLTGVNPKCPEAPLKTGPSEGEDYQIQIAHQINLENQRRFEATQQQEASSVGPLPPVTNNIAKVAEGEVGYAGQLCPNGKHDKTKYDGCLQWCAYFATWVVKQAGYNIPSIGSSRGVYDWYSNGHSVFTDPAQADEGDVIVWKRNSESGHIGIVIQNDSANKTLIIVEGNTTHDIVKANSYSYSAVVDRGDGLSLLGFGRI